ncbi:FAD-binding protein [Paenibacillus koleovorans]|uniref:FAD-binding protein n=1 Tax=Paenibacillus koleovorans TaxID=121608 RepID=UPI000FDA1D82
MATDAPDQNPYLITDYSRLRPVKVDRVVPGHEEDQLVELVREAKAKGLTLSIAGQRHSQGGHTYYKDGIMVDMTSFNRILDVDPARRTIRVQAGATWEDVQEAVNPYGLSVKVMQSQNIFTVGGSISINAHGRDIRSGSLIKSVESFRLLLADGTIQTVSRSENEDLFPLALGGYGLFGIILDVTLTLTEDELYRIETEPVTTADYSEYFANKVQADPQIRQHLARISVAPDSFLTEIVAINYRLENKEPLGPYRKLKAGDQGVLPSKLLFQLNRSSDWGKNVFWQTQHKYYDSLQGDLISRNNAMRSKSAFMEYTAASSHDLLQEYFIPVDRFADFVSAVGPILQEERLNLLNITVRYVQEDRESLLSYAAKDSFALVCLFHLPITSEGQARSQKAIQRLLDAVIDHHGTYYLPYAPFPSLEQFRAVYPQEKSFFEKKRLYDPGGLFRSYFYEEYKGDDR